MSESVGEWHSKISLPAALNLAVCFSAGAGAFLGMSLLAIGMRLPLTSFELADKLLYTLLSAVAAIRFYFLVLTRARKDSRQTLGL